MEAELIHNNLIQRHGTDIVAHQLSRAAQAYGSQRTTS